MSGSPPVTVNDPERGAGVGMAGTGRRTLVSTALGLSIVLLAATDGPLGDGHATVVRSAGFGVGTHAHVRLAAPVPITGPSSPTTDPRPGSAMPRRLVIPRIGVDAAIEQVGVDGSGRMGVPTRPADVAWYALGPAPGEPGDAVIDGHLDWYDMPRAVFYDLDNLRPGDEVDVVSGTERVRFVVTTTQIVPYTARPPGLFDLAGEPRLSLITCAGSWDNRRGTYAKRLVVTARGMALAGQAAP